MSQQPSSTQTPSVTRSLRIANLVVAFALFLIVASVGEKAYRLMLPTDGWAFVSGDIGGPDQDRPFYTRNLLGLPSPLMPGDKLLAVDGRPFEEIAYRANHAQAQLPPNWHAGSTVRYTVERNGRPMTLDVPLCNWTLPSVLQGFFAMPELLASLLLAAVGWFVLLRRPLEPAAGPLLLFSNSLLVVNISNGVVGVGLPEMLTPNLLPIAGFFSGWIYATLMFPSLLLLTITFPRPKRFLSRYPIPVTVLLYGTIPALLLALGPIATVGWLATLSLALLSLIALVHSLFAVRDPVGRAQMRWVLGGLAVMIFGFIPLNLGGFGLIPAPPAWVQAVWFPGMLTAVALGFAVAILRYRLFEIDVIVNRVLVYGGLTLCVVAVYVLVVGYFDNLLDIQDNAVPSLVVTGLVAVLFQPLRVRFQRAVDRLMYGDRDEPYRVLARLGQRLEGTFETTAILPTLASTVKESLRLPYAAIALSSQGTDGNVVAVGTPSAEPVRFPLLYQGETVGQLLVSPRRGEETLLEADRRLLSDLASQAGAAVHAVRLTTDLQHSNERLRTARERLVIAREEERRRLRRDLHDGLGPALASQSLKVGAIRRLLDRDRASANTLLSELGSDIQATVDDVRRLVYDLRPPALDELGLVGALRESAAQYQDQTGTDGGLKVVVEAQDPLPALPAAVEVAAYRIAREALTNVVRHARARNSTVRISADEGSLCVEVADDGVGLPIERKAGVGLLSMRERAEEVGGTLTADSAPNGGTRIIARLPISPREQES